MARPKKSESEEKIYLKEKADSINACLNKLEDICKTSNVEQKEDYSGQIGLLVGKIMANFTDLTDVLGLYGLD